MKYSRFLILLLLAGCPANTGNLNISAVQRVSALCNTYSSTIIALAGFRAQGKLSAGQISGVDHSIKIADPICTGPQPTETNAVAMLDNLEAAVLEMTLVKEEVQ
jgi:hypothetical protein